MIRPPPLISVVIPTYNAPALLLETLGTVLAQTFTDYEIVIVNDGSPDDTAERIAAYAAEHAGAIAGRLRIVTQENRGIGDARNRGIAEARGKYVALLDHDDLWKPGKLAAQVAFMESHPQCVGCTVPWANSNEPVKCIFDLGICDADGIVRNPLGVLADGWPFLISSSILFDRQRAEGLKYETLPRCIEDVPFQLGLLGRGKFGVAGREILLVYRYHAANYSSQASFYYNGVRMLRRLDREGRFAEFAGRDRAALTRFFAQVGRSAAYRQLLAGLRGRGCWLYLRELPYQLRQMRWKYLAIYPILAILPRSVLALHWKGIEMR